MADSNDLRVLSLVTNKTAPFYQNQVKALEQKGVSVTTISPQSDIPRDSGPVFQDGSNRRSYIDYLWFYSSILKNQTKSFDLVHANYGITAPFAVLQSIRPLIISFWGSDLRGKNEHLCNMCARLADRVILPSNELVKYLSTGYEIIPFGIDENIFRPLPQDKMRKELGWGKDQTIVLFPYPPSRAVKNFPLAEKVVDNVCMDIELKTISNVPHEEVPLYMNASDAVLVTSKEESGPMVIKEAALCNVPVISTNVGFASEVLESVSNSYVASSEHELIERLTEVLLLGDRSDGRKHLKEEANLEQMGDRLLNTYLQVLR